MLRSAFCSGLALVGLLLGDAPARADVVVRVPFVHVEVGGPGVYVRAPFVRVFVPSVRPVYYMEPAQAVPAGEALPAPQVIPEGAPIQPAQPAPAKAQTLEDFARTFQPKPGNYEMSLINPVTQQPTTVRFTMPQGTPRRVRIVNNSVEFDYGVRRFVRIEFDADGVQVTTR